MIPHHVHIGSHRAYFSFNFTREQYRTGSYCYFIAWPSCGYLVNNHIIIGLIQILAAIFCPLVTCSNVPAISFHSILINLQDNFQTLNGKHFSQLVLSKSN